MQIEIFSSDDLPDLETKVNEFLNSGVLVHNILQSAANGYPTNLTITVVYDKTMPNPIGVDDLPM